MKQKILLSLVAVLLTALSAQAYYFKSGDLYYNITSGTTVEVTFDPGTNYQGLTTATIPETVTYNGTTYSVTSIGSSAFHGCSSLTSITIPNSVTSIGDYAFQGCSSLTSITIPNSVTSIGNYAFADCSSLTAITIPNSVTSIGKMAFQYCSSLTSITIPNSVTSISKNAFKRCYSLTSITIPNSVTSIGSGAFWDCSSLTAITIPNSVTSIGKAAFQFSGLTSITIPNSVDSISESAFSECDGLTSVTISNSETNIAKNAFRGGNLSSITCSLDHFIELFSNSNPTSINILEAPTCIPNNTFAKKSALVSISIPYSVTCIGDSVFADCYNLQFVNIPSILTHVGKDAFINTRWLGNMPNGGVYIGNVLYTYKGTMPQNTSITVRPGTISISPKAFINCSGLTSIAIPNSVTNVGYMVFAGCSGLSSIIIESGNTVYDSRNNCNAIVETASNTLLAGCSATIIPNSVTSIGGRAFDGCDSLTSITIPNSVTNIGEEAFSDCSGLTSITIPNSVTSIGKMAFRGCSSLTSISIPNSVTNMGEGTFYECTSLTSITLPNSLTSIENYTFRGCSSLTSISIPNSVTNIGEGTFYECTSLTSITLPKSLTSIENYTFRGCSSLTSISIPNSVTNIGESAFHLCNGLSSATIGNGVTSIGDAAFAYCDSLTSISIPNSVTNIGNQAFTACSGLTTVTMGNSVASIGQSAFRNCTNLSSIKLKATSPPTCDGLYVFDGLPFDMKIIIPCGTIDAYRSLSPWTYYPLVTSVMFELKLLSSNEAMGSVQLVDVIGCDSIGTLQAHPQLGYKFVKWSDGVTDNPRTIVFTQDTSFTAEFTKSAYNITLTHEGDGTIEGDTTVQLQDSVTLTAVADYGWQFCCWSDSSFNNPRTIVVTADCEYHAIFVRQQFSLTAIAENGVVDGVGTFAYEDTCQLTATPATGYHFVQWSDGITENPRSIVLTKDTNLTAEFARNHYQITTSYTGNGMTQGDTVVLYQDTITLSALADYGWEFSGWEDGNTDNPRVVVATEDKDYKAIFVRQQFSLTAIAENGVVDGVGTFTYEDTCQLTATPNTGYHFVQWSDGVTENPRSIVLTKDTNLTAEFTKNSYRIYLTHEGAGTIEGDTTALYQDTIALNAVADYGWQFSGWSDGVLDNPRSIVITADCEYHAIFVKRSFTITVAGENGTIEGAGTFEYETTCQLTATPDFGYHFAQWSDGVTDNPRSLVLTQDTMFTAEFAKNYSGQCGDSLYWSYDTTTISITGSGAMHNYSDSLMPWYLFRDSITAVEMVNTATTIGDNAFSNCSKLSKLTISEGIESVGANAFMGCTQLTNITCHPIIPPYAVTSSFENYDTYLRVPCSSKSQYMADAVWGQFKYIECIEEETDIESVESESSEQSVRKIYRDGNVYIIRDGEEYSILGQKL